MAATRRSDADADGFTTDERAPMTERANKVNAAKGPEKVDRTAEVPAKAAVVADADRILAG